MVVALRRDLVVGCESSPAMIHDASRAAPQSRRLRGVRSLRVRGSGRIVLDLTGTGRVTLQRGRFDDFCFEGRGVPKYVSADCVHLDRAVGRIVLEGDQVSLTFRGGVADVELLGLFEVELAGDPVPWRRRAGARKAA